MFCQGPFDLLVAADGLRSQVRKSCMTGNREGLDFGSLKFPALDGFPSAMWIWRRVLCKKKHLLLFLKVCSLIFQAYDGMPSVTPDDHLAAKQSSNRQTARRKQQPRHVKDLIAWWCKAWFPERVWQLGLVISWYGTNLVEPCFLY